MVLRGGAFGVGYENGALENGILNLYLTKALMRIQQEGTIYELEDGPSADIKFSLILGLPT